MDGSVLQEISSFNMLGLTFFSKLDWGSYIIFVAKTTSKKLEALIRSMKFFCSYYFGRRSAELVELVPFPYSRGKATRCSNRLHDFSVTIPRSYKDVYVNSFFPPTARFWNSLPIECFPLTYDLSGCKSRINRLLLTVGSY